MPRALRLGFLLNPWAGVGGEAGLKGSDGDEVRARALAAGAQVRAPARAARFLAALPAGGIEFLCWGGAMGEDCLVAAGRAAQVAGRPAEPSSAADTRAAAAALLAAGADLLVFVGGDGTARDVLDAVGLRLPVLGVPAGVKMYSGCFAVSPEAAAAVVARLVRGEPVDVSEAEVRDIDEQALREDRVQSRRHGSLRVPGLGPLVQQVKCSSQDDERLQQQEIAAWVAETRVPGELWLVGPGSTTRALMEALGLRSTLIGFDLVLDGQLLAADVDGKALLAALAQYPQARALLTPTGGQGFLLGRGNQQLGAAQVRALGRDHIRVLATPAKLAALRGRPLLVDTGDVALDRELAGWWPVVCGYEQEVLCRVAAAGDQAAAP